MKTNIEERLGEINYFDLKLPIEDSFVVYPIRILDPLGRLIKEYSNVEVLGMIRESFEDLENNIFQSHMGRYRRPKKRGHKK